MPGLPHCLKCYSTVTGADYSMPAKAVSVPRHTRICQPPPVAALKWGSQNALVLQKHFQRCNSYNSSRPMLHTNCWARCREKRVKHQPLPPTVPRKLSRVWILSSQVLLTVKASVLCCEDRLHRATSLFHHSFKFTSAFVRKVLLHLAGAAGVTLWADSQVLP